LLATGDLAGPPRPNKTTKKKQKKHKFFLIFFFLAVGDLMGLCRAACAEQDDKKKFKNLKNYLLFILFFIGQMQPRGAPWGRMRRAGQPKKIK
jgi:hypothetical protein